MSDDINILALVKGEERYVFMYTDTNRDAIINQLGQFAANPDLSFSWYDAAVLSIKARKDGAAKKSRFSDAPITGACDTNDGGKP